MIKNYFKLICLILFVVISQKVFSQSMINVGENDKILIGKNIQYLEDPNKEFSFEQVLSPSFQNKMLNSEKDILFFDYQNSTYWLKFTVKNTSNNDARFFLVIDYPLLYKIHPRQCILGN